MIRNFNPTLEQGLASLAMLFGTIALVLISIVAVAAAALLVDLLLRELYARIRRSAVRPVLGPTDDAP